ncbi:hypothetical protein [Thetidibacter halocola]|uniref:Lipoprotein n=1 Tax=Thetidibacter halocola TaxID=2827239 RepID=A0A8J7WA71_9RHOB|nr:hypothetical protein [Thetidibacter halocola]MBS0123835.1 hypothetical protein [Thetidibacter halocola]
MIRPIAAFAGLALWLTACTDATRDLDGPFEPMGDFRLGYSEVVAPNLERLLISRDATQEEWITAVDQAMERRFGRFEGDKFYHLGISVEAYSLPPPVVPGKSALAMRVTVWDDATQQKLNAETKVISVIKVFESRITMTREQQIDILAADAAKELETWLREQYQTQGWFGGTVAPPVDPALVPPEG